MNSAVTVICGNKKKLVEIDRESLSNTRAIIKRKFSHLEENFILRARTVSTNEDYDVEDDDDLKGHSQTVTFLAQDTKEPVPVTSPEERSTDQRRSSQVATVIYGQQKKRVTINCECLQTTRERIRERFPGLYESFKLLALSDGTNDQYDIDDDVDLRSHSEATTFLVRVDESSQGQGTNQSDGAPVTCICGSECKLLKIDRESLQNTRNIMCESFKIGQNFRLLVLIAENDAQYDLQNEADFQKFSQCTTFVIKPNRSQQTEKCGETDFAPPPYTPTSFNPLPTGKQETAGVIQHVIRRFEETPEPLPLPQQQISLLNCLPTQDSEVVKTATLNLKSDVDIPGIHNTLDLFGDCLGLAHYGAEASENMSLVSKVQELQFEALHLCQNTDVAMIRFKNVSDEILQLLTSVFGYLSDRLTSVAVKKIKRMGELADGMKTTSGMVGEKVTGAIDHVEEAIKESADRRGGALAEVAQREAVSSSGQANPKTYLTLNERFKQFFSLSARRQRRTSEEQEAPRLNTVAITEKLLAAARKIGDEVSDDGTTRGSMVTEALHGTVVALTSLKSAFESTDAFWQTIHMQCESAAQANKDIYDTSGGDTESMDFWCSKGFQTEAKNLYARFMALRTVCSDIHNGLGRVQNNMLFSIRDNPTPEEARSKIKGMVSKFQEKTKAIKERFEEEEKLATAANAVEETQNDDTDSAGDCEEAAACVARGMVDYSPFHNQR